MRVRVRPGFAFHKIERYVSADGTILKEKVAEVILGPAVIEASVQEIHGQEHKVELLSHESATLALPARADEALDAEAELNPSSEETEAPERQPARSACARCGREAEGEPASGSRYYCSTRCTVLTQHEALAHAPATKPSIIDALSDPQLFANAFPERESWNAWLTFLRTLFALPMSETDAEIFSRHTGRGALPVAVAREAWVIAGRRGGKSRIAALVAVYLAAFRDYSPVLAPGERGTVMVIAADRRQARTVLRYITGLLDGSRLLSQLVENRTKESIDLRNRITLEVHTASFRAVRGYTVVAAVLDEVAYWPSDEESANPDSEIVNALRPGMATVPGSLLMAISSPYARRGALWQAHRDNFGREGAVLVWQADSLSMNPTIPARVIEEAYAEDEPAAAAEYGAQFRRDVESFIPREIVEQCTVAGRVELPPMLSASYFGFVDPSGGSSDSMTLAIAHSEKDGRVVLDLVRERKPPFSPDEVVKEFAETLRSYRVHTVTGDRYAGEWPRERFAAHGIRYQPSENAKSELYGALLPLLNSRRVDLLDNARLTAQLVSLERRTARGGRDTIDHAPGRHDDLINAAAGALTLAAKEGSASAPRFWRVGSRTGPERGWVRLT